MRIRSVLPAIVLLTACPAPEPDEPAPLEVDGIVRPVADDVRWVAAIDNPYFPLPTGATWHYEAMSDEGLETDDVEVLAQTRVVNGVTATVVHDLVRLDGEIVEETWDWYAQDDEGSVWYLGEDTCEWEDGMCVVHAGAWEWGVDGALPGIIMPGDPQADGQPFFQEYYPGEAEDVGEVIGVGEAIEVPAGSFTDCVRTRDTSHLDPGLDEQKVYCPGVGNVLVLEPGVSVELLSHSGLLGP
ncbi:MAG: hypothetical protein H6712_12605 [Myxococcales bacterium]|nr:hypothetical protein [Myxococcales bacterium]MCB9714698.1 hypothetical protein [Myxococcales bacterium]